MGCKISVGIQKLGGSHYALIPSIVMTELKLHGEKEVLVEYSRLRNVIKDECDKFCEEGGNVNLTLEDEKSLIGVVGFVDKTNMTLYSNDKHFIIPFDFIKSLTPVSEKLGEELPTKLGEDK